MKENKYITWKLQRALINLITKDYSLVLLNSIVACWSIHTMHFCGQSLKGVKAYEVTVFNHTVFTIIRVI
jgi:hypothetical protein